MLILNIHAHYAYHITKQWIKYLVLYEFKYIKQASNVQNRTNIIRVDLQFHHKIIVASNPFKICPIHCLVCGLSWILMTIWYIFRYTECRVVHCGRYIQIFIIRWNIQCITQRMILRVWYTFPIQLHQLFPNENENFLSSFVKKHRILVVYIAMHSRISVTPDKGLSDQNFI